MTDTKLPMQQTTQIQKKLIKKYREPFDKELIRLAFCNPVEIFDPNTRTMRHPLDWPIDLQHAVKTINYRVKDNGELVVKNVSFHNKVRVLDMLAKHIGFYGVHQAQKGEAQAKTQNSSEIIEAVADLVNAVKAAADGSGAIPVDATVVNTKTQNITTKKEPVPLEINL